MHTKDMHKRVHVLATALNKLLTDLEFELATEEEQNRIDAEKSAAVEQAKREILAERDVIVKPLVK